MSVLKWTWKIIWRCVLVPIIVAIVAMIGTMFFINDTNQSQEGGKSINQNYGTSYQRNQEVASNNPTFVNKYNAYNSKDQRYKRKYVEMEDSDFDTSGIVTMIALFATFIFMVIYTIIDIRDIRREARKLNT